MTKPPTPPLPPPHLGVREEEHHVSLLHARHLAEAAQVLVEAVVAVAAAQLDLEAGVATYVRGQPGQRLLARAAHAHQQGVAPLLADHTGYPVGGRGAGERCIVKVTTSSLF